MTAKTHLRGDEILLVAEIHGARALREALATLKTHAQHFESSPSAETFLRRICDRATNQDPDA
jgi:guanylate kinase